MPEPARTPESPGATVPRTQSVLGAAERHLYPTYSRPPVVLGSGSGSRVRDTEGREYVDLIGGIAVNALGHCHPRLVSVIADQATRLVHSSNLFHHPYQGRLAERLANISGLSRAFFCNSGTEAVEAALKLARARARALGEEGRTGIVALQGSFHGRTLGSLSATAEESYRAPFKPLLPGVRFVPPSDPAALREAVGRDTAAVLIEPIQGEGGVRCLSDGYLRAARDVCDRAGALLVFDEIQCGLGRTGAWFAHQQSRVRPDLVCIAKPLAGGLPLGALLGREDTAAHLGPGSHGSTFGGGPLACRVALEFLSVVEEEGLLERVAELGGKTLSALRRLASRTPVVRDVRGRGLMIGVEIDRGVQAVVEKLLRRGWLVGSCRGRVLRILPPYTIEPELLDRFVFDLESVLGGDLS